MEHVQPYLDSLSAHPEWAIAIIFLVAFGEALLIIGLFVPSTVVLVGAGILVGTGKLGFWEVFTATAVGAIAGDQVSYWAGRFYGDKLKQMWPLSAYPHLVDRGEAYVRVHGGKSIAIGRFVPGIKAVVPGIIGMLGMSQLYFVLVNVSSGLVWTALHIVPGILIGQGLSIAGELSERLVVVLLLLLAVTAALGWGIRIVVGWLSPVINGEMHRLSTWAKAQPSKTVQRMGRVLSPERPRAKVILLFFVAALILLVMLINMVTGLLLPHAISDMDLSINNLMLSLRSSPGDDVMSTISMFGNRITLGILSVFVLTWLAWKRAWFEAALAFATVAAGQTFTILLKFLVARERPHTPLSFHNIDIYSFPSSHAVMSGVVLGIIAFFISIGRSRWTRALIASVFGVLIIAISFSRIYLGLHWMSDVVGGLLIAAFLVSVFGIIAATTVPRRIKPRQLLPAFVCVMALVIMIYIVPNAGRGGYQSFGRPQLQTVELKDIEKADLPKRRIVLLGKTGEVFPMRVFGRTDAIKKLVLRAGWSDSPAWVWAATFGYLNTSAAIQELLPLPMLHEGARAKLTFTKNGDGQSES